MAEFRPAGWRKIGQEWVPPQWAKHPPVPTVAPLPPKMPETRRSAPGCEQLYDGSVGGYHTIIPVSPGADAPAGAVSVPVHFDTQDAFLLQQITVVDGEGVNIQISDTRRNRQLFSQSVASEIFSPMYSGQAYRLPRPYLVYPSSDLVVSFSSGENEFGLEPRLALHGWRYRGGAVGPERPPPAEDFYIYAADPQGGPVRVLVEADHDFILTQIVSAGVTQVTDMKLTRQLFEGVPPDGIYENPVGDLHALPQPYTFTANTRIEVSGSDLVYLVGYRRWHRCT